MTIRIAAIEVSHWHALNDAAYLRHLVNQGELLGLRLLSLHNLHFLLELTALARRAIVAGRLADFKREALGRLTIESEAALWHS